MDGGNGRKGGISETGGKGEEKHHRIMTFVDAHIRLQYTDSTQLHIAAERTYLIYTI